MPIALIGLMIHLVSESLGLFKLIDRFGLARGANQLLEAFSFCGPVREDRDFASRAIGAKLGLDPREARRQVPLLPERATKDTGMPKADLRL